MRKLELAEFRQIQLDILIHTAEFCDSHNIHYWIDNGTLLGAIRHKGYIPWDDDIDIGMLRDDYEKMITAFNRENDRYFLACLETKPEFFLPHAKVLDLNTTLFEPNEKGFKIAVNIDIKVYDNAPNDPKLLRAQFNRRDIYRKLFLWQHDFGNHSSILKGLIMRAFNLFLKFFPDSFFIEKMIENCKRYHTKNASEVGDFSSYTRQHCSKKVFDGFIDVEFEGFVFKAPIGYDEWLRSFYGDYMQLPPVEKRISHHSFVAYLND